MKKYFKLIKNPYELDKETQWEEFIIPVYRNSFIVRDDEILGSRGYGLSEL